MIDKSFAAVKFAGIAAQRRKGCSPLYVDGLLYHQKIITDQSVDYIKSRRALENVDDAIPVHGGLYWQRDKLFKIFPQRISDSQQVRIQITYRSSIKLVSVRKLAQL